jgi:hypothetical protein
LAGLTTVPNPGPDTEVTEDATTGWATIGSVLYRQAGSEALHHYLRHSYLVSFQGQAIPATGLRIDLASETTIDEVEVNTELPLAQPPLRLTIVRQQAGIAIGWSGQGTLEEANAVTGPWTPATGASNPHVVQPTAAQKFYRERQ